MEKTTHLVIVQRQSPEWGTISKEAFRQQSRRFCEMAGLPLEQVNDTVELWDKTLKLSYCTVRQQLKDIASENMRKVRNSTLINLATLELSIIEDANLYLFIDDDDWVCPGITEKLSVISQLGLDGVVWGSIAFGTHKKSALQIRALDGYCYTNNYAVTGAALKALMTRESSPAQHWDAATLLKNRSQQISEYLSVTNKSPASTCYLMHTLQGNFDNQALLRNIIKEYLDRCHAYDTELPESVQWAMPLIQQTLEIFKAV